MTTTKLDEFTRSYIETLLWSATDDNDDPLDQRYDESDIAPETLARIVKDCADFQSQCDDMISESLGDWGQAGHDFWLTRNGHGAGFWDGGWPEPAASRLTAASKEFGEVWVTVTDGQIYMDPPHQEVEEEDDDHTECAGTCGLAACTLEKERQDSSK